MGEFLRDRQRKAGCDTLAMVLLWMMSYPFVFVLFLGCNRPVVEKSPGATEIAIPSDVHSGESDNDEEEYNPEDGGRFKAELIRQIQSASRIVVTEHSNHTDFWTNTKTPEAKDVKKLIYGQITLDAVQKDRQRTQTVLRFLALPIGVRQA